jgi:Ca2+/Na+ antiporter
MKPSAFIAASAAIILLFGLVHLLYTFRGPKLDPRDPDLTARMMAVSPVISSETTMWRCWVGFNASHSFCLIFFGALYGYLAMRHSAFLFHSWFLLALGLVLLLGYATLAKLYWFTTPFRGVVVATVLYFVGIVIYLV